MDSARVFQLVIISAFSAAIALIGLHDLSHRFVKKGPKAEAPSAAKLIKDLQGNVDISKPSLARPTHAAAASHDEPTATSEKAVGAVGGGIGVVVDKLLPD